MRQETETETEREMYGQGEDERDEIRPFHFEACYGSRHELKLLLNSDRFIKDKEGPGIPCACRRLSKASSTPCRAPSGVVMGALLQSC